MTKGRTLVTKGKFFGGGRAQPPKAAMPQIEKERGWAKPNQPPAGPRKKRPIGRLLSSNIIYDSGLQCGSDRSSRRFQQYCVFITVSKLRNPTASASGDSGVKLLLSRGQQPPLFSASPWLGCHRHALPPPAFVMCYDGGHAGIGCATC